MPCLCVFYGLWGWCSFAVWIVRTAFLLQTFSALCYVTTFPSSYCSSHETPHNKTSFFHASFRVAGMTSYFGSKYNSFLTGFFSLANDAHADEYRCTIMHGRLTTNAYASIIQGTGDGVKNPNSQNGNIANQCVISPRADSIRKRFRFPSEQSSSLFLL